MEKVSILLISSIYITLVVGSVLVDMNVIIKATDQLQMNNPLIYDDDDILSINLKLKLYKKLFLNYHSTTCLNTQQINFQDKKTFVVFSKLQNFTWKLKYYYGFSTILVVSNIKNETDLENLSETIDINAQVYFLDYTSSSLYEAYTINNYKITKFLGIFCLPWPNY